MSTPGSNSRSRPGSPFAPKRWVRLSRAPSLHEQFSVRLKRALIGGEFLPGERINVREVARRFGTSPMPLRDALRRLEAIGAVVIEPRKAPRIATMSSEEYIQVVEMRRLLEARAVALACKRATRSDANRLKQLNNEILVQLRRGDVHGAISANAAFHFHLYEMTGESLLLNTIENLWLRSGPYLQLALQSRSRNGIETLFEWHDELIRAVQARDGEAAAAALLHDIGRGIETYETALVHDTERAKSATDRAG